MITELRKKGPCSLFPLPSPPRWTIVSSDFPSLPASMLRHPLLSYDGYSLFSGQRLGRKSCPSTPSKISKWKILGPFQFHVSMVHVQFFWQGRSPKEFQGFFLSPKNKLSIADHLVNNHLVLHDGRETQLFALWLSP